MSQPNSYNQILKSSSIMGGAAGITMVLGMVRVKFAAILLGLAGVGLHTSYTAIQGLIGTLAGLGIQSSAVREIAAAVGKGDDLATARTVLTLHRLCWFTGLAGMAVMMLASPLISQLTFGHQDHTIDIAGLGLVILLGNLAGGQMALIQGMRRIGHLARVNICAALLGTLAAIAFYTALGLRGIVPTLITTAALQLALACYFARQIPLAPVSLSLRQTLTQAGTMVRLGLVLMSSGLMCSAVTYFTVTLVTQKLGIQAVGLYSAAFALSGIFVSFVLSAMSADYYPRLTGIAPDKAAMQRMVNEQTEIGLLLALPGLLATLALAPWLLQIFYSREFLDATPLLQWFILGCVGRIISWPLGFVMLALGKGRWYLLTETSANLLHAAFIYVGLELFGLQGVAIAFLALYVAYIAIVFFVCKHLIGFRWSAGCIKIVAISMPMFAVSVAASIYVPGPIAISVGVMFAMLLGLYCLHALLQRLDPLHRLVRLLTRVPGVKSLLPKP